MAIHLDVRVYKTKKRALKRVATIKRQDRGVHPDFQRRVDFERLPKRDKPFKYRVTAMTVYHARKRGRPRKHKS